MHGPVNVKHMSHMACNWLRLELLIIRYCSDIENDLLLWAEACTNSCNGGSVSPYEAVNMQMSCACPLLPWHRWCNSLIGIPWIRSKSSQLFVSTSSLSWNVKVYVPLNLEDFFGLTIFVLVAPDYWVRSSDCGKPIVTDDRPLLQHVCFTCYVFNGLSSLQAVTLVPAPQFSCSLWIKCSVYTYKTLRAQCEMYVSPH